jgi:osmotically-inducible protein OsmY
MRENVQVERDVRAELAWDPRVDDAEIRVDATSGVVTLTGTVPSFADKLAAERAAERVFGVRVVANDLSVAVPLHYQRSDSDIARAVVDALAWDVQVPEPRIKASVSDGWINLAGDVEWRYQRDAAERVVRNLAGVRGVTNEITVIAKRVSPRDVSRSIKEALERRADRTADHINVEAVGTVVTLKGNVSSLGDRRAVEGAAWAAPGVTEVHDELAVTV